MRLALEWIVVTVAIPLILLALIGAGIWFIVFYPIKPEHDFDP
jgi:hypothetical protein